MRVLLHLLWTIILVDKFELHCFQAIMTESAPLSSNDGYRNRDVGAINGNKLQPITDTLFPGERLNVDNYIESINGKYILLMRNDGILAIYRTNQWQNPIWKTNTGNHQKTSFVFEKNGILQNLIVYDRQNRALWMADKNGVRDAQLLVLQDDGILVILDSHKRTIWASSNGMANCLTENTSFYGNNIVMGENNLQNSIHDCQESCARHPDCALWSWGKLAWRFNNRCYLKFAKSNDRRVYPELVTGSKHCDTTGYIEPKPTKSINQRPGPQMIPQHPGPQMNPQRPGPQMNPQRPGPQMIPQQSGPQRIPQRQGPQMIPQHPGPPVFPGPPIFLGPPMFPMLG